MTAPGKGSLGRLAEAAPLSSGDRRMVEREEQAREVTQRRVHHAALRERPIGLSLEVDGDKPGRSSDELG